MMRAHVRCTRCRNPLASVAVPSRCEQCGCKVSVPVRGGGFLAALCLATIAHIIGIAIGIAFMLKKD